MLPILQSGSLLDFGNVVLVGMTDQDLRNAIGLRSDDANRVVYYLPQDISTIRTTRTTIA